MWPARHVTGRTQWKRSADNAISPPRCLSDTGLHCVNIAYNRREHSPEASPVPRVSLAIVPYSEASLAPRVSLAIVPYSEASPAPRVSLAIVPYSEASPVPWVSLAIVPYSDV